MKRFLIMMIICLMMLSFACAKDDIADDPLDVLATPQQAANTDIDPSHIAELPLSSSVASISLGQTAAYVFNGTEGITLYGAVEYTNTSSSPIRIQDANFAFTVDGAEITHSFTPIFSDYGAILPGETSFIVLWLPQDVGLSSDVTLKAELTPIACTNERVDITIDHIYLADNYPRMTTLSGRLTCKGASCAINIAYVGFYGENNHFLGAWYFTKNAQLESGDSKNFVVNMEQLPITSLASKAVQTKQLAYGFAY